MFDIGATELLLIVVVAILVIGPKDMPLAMRTAGRWIGKIRKLSGHFRTGLDAMVREAELEDMEKKWKAQNEKVMREHPDGAPAQGDGEMEHTGAYPPAKAAEMKRLAQEKSAANEAAANEAAATNTAGAESATSRVAAKDTPAKSEEPPEKDAG
ncbi:Sec-independent protein translocase protein TatB [Aurantiacibacter rhizosphaerae]|uniref:Sec-independent protein translocase protein TatB n=1 Tax=Aurantiacibacter rhizosphaerae TaxID=2691582 RepID=A0A844XBY5_9SPHN|nr:Sec-independent protein translocase protein TatB [Aurantiacibacter rhizosphaerae]MWV27350.1 twin-arginine translocase subunit TatB [Aurantiacibacter rhizosphaerae]